MQAPVVRAPVDALPTGRTQGEIERLQAAIDKLAPLHVRRDPLQPGDWLSSHHEDGQTFEEYVNGSPITPTEKRKALVVQPFGDIEQRPVLSTLTKYLEAFFGLPTRQLPLLSIDLMPLGTQRDSRGYGPQLLTPVILDRVLIPRLPSDAMAYIAFTTYDLWPGGNWNFVFGQARLDSRVGVWSLARNGEVDTPAGYRTALVRGMKIASHETGHMFGMSHCTAYLCNMSGINSLEESDLTPPWLCPECLAKLSWALREPPDAHLRRLRELFRSLELPEIVSHYERSLTALGGSGKSGPSRSGKSDPCRKQKSG
jgi:archaemetzincin